MENILILISEHIRCSLLRVYTELRNLFVSLQPSLNFFPSPDNQELYTVVQQTASQLSQFYRPRLSSVAPITSNFTSNSSGNIFWLPLGWWRCLVISQPSHFLRQEYYHHKDYYMSSVYHKDRHAHIYTGNIWQTSTSKSCSDGMCFCDDVTKRDFCSSSGQNAASLPVICFRSSLGLLQWFLGHRKLAQWGHLGTRGERPYRQTTGTAVPEKQVPRSDASVMLIWFVNSVALFEGNLPPTPATISKGKDADPVWHWLH